MATCFGSSEPSSGHYLIYGHGAFSEVSAHIMGSHIVYK